MKLSDMARPGIVILGVAGVAATALAGFAAGLMVARDPEGARRAVRRAAREAGRGLKQAAHLAAEAREQFGDLWAEAREEALAERESHQTQGDGTSARPRRRRGTRRTKTGPQQATDSEPAFKPDDSQAG